MLKNKIIYLLLSLFLMNTILIAEDKSQLKLGVGLLGSSIPNYIGSKKSTTYILPFPYINYKSKFLEIDRDKMRGKLFQKDKFNLDISLSASVPVDSNKNTSRKNMPDLDPMLEIGPSFEFNLYKDNNQNLNFELPIRSIIATNFKHINDKGFISELKLSYNKYIEKFNIKLSTALVFANDKYHQYIYGVDKKFATAKRKAYDANSGYSGFKTTLGLNYTNKNMWYGSFLRYYNLSNTVYENSPLLERKNSLFFGFGIAYIFYSN